MQSVSEAWKRNQERNLTSQAYISISFDLDDPKGYSDGVPSDNGHTPYADDAGILLKSPTAPLKVGDFERSQFLLDGSFSVPKSSYASTDARRGYVSSVLSSSDGSFPSYPAIYMNFSSVHSQRITGMTVKFTENMDDEFPISFAVYATENGVDTLIASVTDNSSPTWSIDGILVTAYSKLWIVFRKWSLPNRRARLSNIFLGIKMNFFRDQLTSYSEKRKSDPLEASVPSLSVSFSIDNTDGKFNPNDEDSSFSLLSQRQKINIEYGFEKIAGQREVIASGNYYLTSWEVKQNSLVASFVADDLISFLTENYYGGYSDIGNSSYSIGALLTSIFEELVSKRIIPLLDGGALPYYVDSSLNSVYTQAPLPSCTYKEAILYLAQAGASAVSIERSGRISIAPKTLSFDASGNLSIDGDYVINPLKQYDFPELSLQKPLAEIDVNMYSYHYAKETDGTTIKVEELYNGSFVVASAGTHSFTFVFTKLARLTSVSVGTLVSASNNSCVVSITTSSDNETVSLVLKGNPIEKSYVVYSILNPNIEKSQGLTQIVDNPMITNQSTAQAVASWLLQYLKNRNQYSAKFRIDPRLDPLDQIGIMDKYNNENSVLVSEETINYKGAFHGTMKGRVIKQ